MKTLSLSTPMVSLIVTSFLFPTLVAGVQGVGGWHIDEGSCSPRQIAFLNKYLNRARVAHINVATYLTRYENKAFDALAWKVVGGQDGFTAALTAQTVFAGGSIQGGVPEIQGLASWKGPISYAESLTSPNGMVAYLFLFYELLRC